MDVSYYMGIVLQVLSNWQVIAAIVLALLVMFAASGLANLYYVYNPRPKVVREKAAKSAAPPKQAAAPDGDEEEESEEE
jgi:hypothetical protein